VHFSTAGMRFEPAVGPAVPTTQHLALTPTWVGRGGAIAAELPSFAPVVQQGRTATYAHAPGVTERYEVRPEGVELSWVFEQPLHGEGDLVVRYAIDTNMPDPRPVDGGLSFELPDIGSVHIGGVTGIDALGRTCAGGMRHLDGTLRLSLPATFVETACYPIVLDPTFGWGSACYFSPRSACCWSRRFCSLIWERCCS
jgi:hypothetical protein